ncbi:MAG: T9SS type A sorting domain-containing protein [Fluviicola sp.]|nr:T9SS type A sorting domain-containing protein [Fluviicola sp.]
MKQFKILLAAVLLSNLSHAQTAPAHLKYFGFALIDCLWDDPQDAGNTTNYIAEVDSFSNIAHMCIYDYLDNITTRVNLMNSYCVQPLVHIQSVFYERVDANGLSGDNYDLIANFSSRWNTFKTINASSLNNSKIAGFYIMDEPFWNGVTFAELDTICAIVKADFPTIPIMIIEASPVISLMQIPTSVDWLSMDQYGIPSPHTDPGYLANIALLKSKRSTSTQEIFLTIDDQWLPYYGTAGFAPDSVAFMVQNYYNLAVADTSIIGLLGYVWPGGLDDPGHLGVRNLPQNVIDKNIEIGQLIKANYNPCLAGLNEESVQTIEVYPNPANDEVSFILEKGVYIISIVNLTGEKVIEKELISTGEVTINLDKINSGVYFYEVKLENVFIGKGKLIKQ